MRPATRGGSRLAAKEARLDLARKREAKAQEEASHIAIDAISHYGPFEDKTWVNAAYWPSRTQLRDADIVLYLESLGFWPATADQWLVISGANNPQLLLQLQEHREEAGHTWYLIDCELSPKTGCYTRSCLLEDGSRFHQGRSGYLRNTLQETLQWRAPRRLEHLRQGLHDFVKEDLGGFYPDHFRDTPFAQRGGLPGTTARLQEWLSSLAEFLNSSQARPAFVSSVLCFFRPPMRKMLEETPNS